MKSNIKLGTLFGVPFGLHWSWFVIFILVASSLSLGYFRMTLPGMDRIVYWTLGICTSLLFFISVLAHEIGHAIVAQLNKIEVENITLFVFGGVAQIAHEPRQPGEEFRIAIAGPLVSLACGLLFGVIWLTVRPVSIISVPAEWLAQINLSLVAFNLIPAIPLDGGRVFRAILWKLTGSFSKATRFSGMGSRLIAMGFIGFGLFTGFRGNMANGIWLVFIGWFLQSTTSSYTGQTGLQEMLGHVRVAHVMNRDYQFIPAGIRLDQLIRGYVFSGGNHIFFITDNDHLKGMLTLHDIATIPRIDWNRTTAADVMIPINRVIQVHPETTLLSAMTTMDDAHVTHIPVMQGEEVTGLLSREQVIQFLKLRMDIRSQS